MNKLIIFALIVILAILASACGGGKQPSSPAEAKPSEPATQEPVGEPDMESLKKELDISADGRWDSWAMEHDSAANSFSFKILIPKLVSNVWLESYCNMVKTAVIRFAPGHKYKVEIVKGDEVLKECGSK